MNINIMRLYKRVSCVVPYLVFGFTIFPLQLRLARFQFFQLQLKRGHFFLCLFPPHLQTVCLLLGCLQPQAMAIGNKRGLPVSFVKDEVLLSNGHPFMQHPRVCWVSR